MVRLLGVATYQLEIMWDGVSWTDETDHLKEFAIERGMDEQLTRHLAGTLELVLAETTGRFNPVNASSPLQPYITYPLRRVRLSVTYASTVYWLFTGYTTRHESDPGYGAWEARISCMDAFVMLNETKPQEATGDTTGSAIGDILFELGLYTVSGDVSLDDGDDIDYAADGEQTALDVIADLLLTERGWFFVAADGVLTYRDRYAPNRSPYTSSQGAIAGAMQAIAPAVDYAQIRNRATVTRTGGTPQTATGTSPALPAGMYRDYPAIESDYLATDTQALALARHIVLKGQNPVAPVRYLDLSNGSADGFAQLLARELGDRVTVTEALGGTSGDYHIRRITHAVNWSGQIHRGSWSLEQRDTTTQPFIVGQSLVGGPDLITY